MTKTIKVGGLLIASIVMASSLTGCGGLFTRDAADTEESVLLGQDGQTLWESNLQYVKIVNRDTAGIANEHPEAITTDEMRSVLSSLFVIERVLISKQENPLFSRSELTILSAALSSGLRQAATNEDVNFVSIGSHKGAFAKERKTTTGRVFISEGRLNIIFGIVHEVFRDTDPQTGQQIDRRLNPLVPGKRSFDSKPNVRVALDTGQAYYLDPETGKERADWIVIDIATVLAEAKKASGDVSGSVTPELLEDIARNKQDSNTLRSDIGKMKEIIFDMADEIDRLKQEVEASQSQE